MSRSIDEQVAIVRNAIYGKDVREAIASSMEATYDACQVFQEAAAESAQEAAESAASLVVDATLTEEGKAADAKAAGDRLTQLDELLGEVSDAVDGSAKDIEKLITHNAADVLVDAAHNDGTVGGITWKWNDDGSCKVSGTATSVAARLLSGSMDSIPAGLVPGQTCVVKYHSLKVVLEINQYAEGVLINSVQALDDVSIPLDKNVTGVRVRLVVSSGVTVNDETVTPVLLTSASNADLQKEIKATNQTLLKYNAYDVMDDALRNDGTVNGITWNWQDDGSCAVSGTATALSVRILGGGADVSSPQLMLPGNTYSIKYSSENVALQIEEFSADNVLVRSELLYSDKTYAVASTSARARLRLYVAAGAVVNEVVNPVIVYGNSNAGLAEQMMNIEDNIQKYNAYDVMGDALRNSGTVNGITWNWQDDGSCAVSGTATALSVRILGGGADVSSPQLMLPGNTYSIKYSSENVALQIEEFSADNVLVRSELFYNDKTYAVASTSARARLRLYVAAGTVVNEVVNPVIVRTAIISEIFNESHQVTASGMTLPGNTMIIDYRTGELIENYSALTVTPFIATEGFNSLTIPVLRVLASTISPPIYGLHFYDSRRRSITGYPALWKYDTRGFLDVTFSIPSNAAYFRSTYWADKIRAEDNIPAFHYTLFNNNRARAITHEPPFHTGMENAVRRARQFTDIEWTPLMDLPRDSGAGGEWSMQANGNKHFEDVFKSGVTYKGLPYSGCTISRSAYGYGNFLLGLYVPFDAFITAARYPNSCMSESYYNPDNPRSPTFYGAICSALVCYALGLPKLYQTSKMVMSDSNPDGIPGLAKVANISAMTPNDLRLCDVVLRSGHVAIITDLIRDEDGNVKFVECSEATIVGNMNAKRAKDALGGGGPYGGKCRRKSWQADEFFSWFRLYGIYRYYNEDFFTAAYVPSKFVDTGGEGNPSPVVDLACIPYMGNGFAYIKGYVHNSTILIGDPDYQYLVVSKDGVPWNSDGTGNPYLINGQDAVDVHFTELGEYTAYLCDKTGDTITMRSVSCHWSVIPNARDDDDDGGDD